MMFRFAILLILLTPAYINQSCQAQDENPLSDNPEIAALQTQFREYREEFRGYVKAVQQAGFRYMNSPTPDESFVHWDEYEEKVKAGNAVLERWKPVGLELFDMLTERSEKVDDELVYFVCKTAQNLFDNSEYERTYDLANKLIKNNPENKFAQVYKVRAGILTNRFGDEIATLINSNLEHFQKEDVISGNETNLISNLYHLNGLLKAELEIREKEAAANDLPLIMLETTKGNIEIELFENDTPESVGNFVNLVEKKFYDQLMFHAVLDKTAAETGAYDQDLKIRAVDYQIYDEDRNRGIFAGSIVMVSETRHSGASRFFIALAALPNISGTQTVIGRVKTGMDVVHALNKTHKMGEDNPIPIDNVTPDKIITAKVLRKRDHEYVPNKVNSDNDK